MSVIVEAPNSIHLGGQAFLVDADSDRELAWAEPYVRTQPDVKWILGNYVEADNANENGHIFPIEDLQDKVSTIQHKPLNMVHRPHQIVGCYAAAELLYPKSTEGAASAVARPHVEALAAFYKYYFPELFSIVEAAHKEGQLFYSMEAVPENVTCAGKGDFAGCGQQFEYAGRTSDTYCDHMNEQGSRKILNRPHFTAGALIIPPVRPGWRHADITELSSLISANLEAAERVYDQLAGEFPHLEPVEWERMMAYVLTLGEQDAVTVGGPKRTRPSIGA